MNISHIISALAHSCGVLSATSLGAGQAVDALCFYLAAGTCIALPIAIAGLVFAQQAEPACHRQFSKLGCPASQWRNEALHDQK